MAADTGPIGGNLSHEFVILADTGESKIYTDKRIFEVDSTKTNIENTNPNKYYIASSCFITKLLFRSRSSVVISIAAICKFNYTVFVD